MSSNRFPSFMLKPKRFSQPESGGTAKSSSNFTTSASASLTSSFMSPTTNSSKSRINKPSSGVLKTPTKTMLKTSNLTNSRKPSSTLSGSKSSAISLQSSTSDDLSKALVLKRKNRSRNSTPSLERSKSVNRAKKGEKTVDVTENIDECQSETAEENRKLEMHPDGPFEILEGNFDFYSILARSKLWETEEDEEQNTRVKGSPTNDITIESLPPMIAVQNEESHSGRYVKQRESEIWGSMRASTAEESSTPPSLTSIGEDETKAHAEAIELGKVTEEEMITRDENNNVLETIKNTIYRSLPFFEVSRPSTTTATVSPTPSVDEKIERGKKKETVPEADYDKGNRQASFSTSKELDQVNESEGKINVQPSLNSNIHNSRPPPGIFLHGRNSDSSLIPLKIEEQLQEALGVSCRPSSVESQQEHCSRQLKNHFNLQTKLEMGEVVKIVEPLSEESPPPLTKSGNEITESSPSSSSQLVLNACTSEQGVVAETDHSCAFENNPKTGTTTTAATTKHIISPTSSFTSAAAADEEFFCADMVKDFQELDSQQTQTQSVNSHDAETGTENNTEGVKMKKMMSLVMAVNTGVDISPSLEQPKKSVRMRGIMKPCRTQSVNIEGTLPAFSPSMSKLVEEKVHHQRVTPEKIKYPQTFSQVWADYGFPPEISISGIIGNIVTMTWASTGKGKEARKFRRIVSENNGANNDTFSAEGDGGEGNRLIETAYDIVNAGLKIASDLIGVEADLEPREDWVRYNGYKIRVCGKKLLLESLHVNCDSNIDSNGIFCRTNQSATSLRPSSASRSELEQSCEGRRVRIVVRLAGPFIHDVEQACLTMATDHTVHHTDGKWTFISGSGENGDNLVEIECPTGVHPKSLAYIVFNGRLLVDAP